MSQKYYLIEDFDPQLDYRNGIAIALNPLPLFYLKKANIPHRILEDFYSEKELRRDEGDFFHQELKWIDGIDRFLKEHIDYCRVHDLALARISYNRIKYFANTVIIQARILQQLASQIPQGSRLIYVRESREETAKKTFHHFKFNEKSLCYSDLLPEICKNHRLIYAIHSFVPSLEEKTIHLSFGRKIANITDAFKNTANQLLKKVMRHIYLMTHTKPCLPKPMGLRVLFIHCGSYILDPVIQMLRNSGAQIYLRIDTAIYRKFLLSKKKCWDMGKVVHDAEEEVISSQCREAADQLFLKGREILNWMNKEAGVKIDHIVSPYFRSFVEINCCEMIIHARRYLYFLEREKIDYIVSHTSSDYSVKSAILASQMSTVCQAVGLQHGCDAFDDKVMRLTEIDPFDYYFATDGISEMKFRTYAADPYVSPCEIYQSPHFLEAARAKSGAYKRFPQRKQRILYIPTSLDNLHTRYFNCMTYPILWFLEYQRKLFDYFATKSDHFEFIYKQPPGRTKFVKNVVLPHLQEKKYANIRIDSRETRECFRQADAVIMDRPTTGYFEAMMSGRPILALYPDFIAGLINKQIAPYFGKTLQMFSSFEEAREKIEIFLNSDPNEYIKALPLRQDPIFKILKQKSKRSNLVLEIKKTGSAL